MTDQPKCHSCGAFIPPDGFVADDLPRVSSDCRPAARTGALAACPACGLAQTVVDARWREAADEVYEAYEIYAAANGEEQKVASSDGLTSRSEVLVTHWALEGMLPPEGHLLDVGCGNGSFLRAFAGRFPGWTLSAVETSDRDLPRLQAIRGFADFFLVGRDEIRGRFDALSLVHVLEHLAAPSEHLARLRSHAKPDAALLVEVPGWLDNPFALMISDHASHFTPSSLGEVVNRSGWQVARVASDWVRKELSLTAGNRPGTGRTGPPSAHGTAAEELRRAVAWLKDVARQAADVAAGSRKFGLFGTAIAATWLHQTLPAGASFLVDEDPDRIGRRHMGLPILGPAEVPEGSDVFVGVSPLLSEAIARRLTRPGRRYHPVTAGAASGFNHP